jgi:crotonobetainyl-CoA:carnitine CoA-transferase CaiB-like acyl-CoA transferase
MSALQGLRVLDLGAHNDEVFRELGLDGEEIEQLRLEKVI